MPDSRIDSFPLGLLDRDPRELLPGPEWLLPDGNRSETEIDPAAADSHGMTDLRARGFDDIAPLVLKAMTESPSDFRTPGSLAQEIGVAEPEVRRALAHLGDQVRRPVGGEPLYPDWFRVTARGMTGRELWWRIRALLGHTTPGA